jgi:hypothetical protein
MKCDRAIIQYINGEPADYSLVIAGLEKPERQKGTTLKEVPFKDAYNLFPAIRKNWMPDGTPKA